MPNSVVGFTEIVDDSLQKLYYAKEVKSARIPVQWSDESKVKPLFSNSRCHVELACIEADENPIEHSRASSIKSTRKIPRTPDMGVSMTDKSKWDLLSKELAQKQEMIHRLMKEVDDKSESLKITGTEIVDLRRQIKLL